MSDSPLYKQIKSYIQSNIQTGLWPVGHRITTEVELAKQFEVSRMTVNKAIRDLVSDGILQRRPRLGTFVCLPHKKTSSPLLDFYNISDEIEQKGQSYSNKIIHHTSIIADDNIAVTLGVMLGSPVFYSEIIHFSDDSVLQVEKRWVNSKYAPHYLEQDFSQVTPNQYLLDNCPLSAIEHTVEAMVPNSQLVEMLQLKAHEPCLLLNRRTWSDDKLVSTAQLYHPASKYKVTSKVIY